MYKIGIVVFSDVEELDFIGPYEVLSYANKVKPGFCSVQLVAELPGLLRAFNGLSFLPHATWDRCPPLDALIIPGGKGRLTAMRNAHLLRFIQKQFVNASYVCSVCTGALILAETGLLAGKRAATHANARAELSRLPGIAVSERKIMEAGKIITAGGVSSGLELGMRLLLKLGSRGLAEKVAAGMEYTPDPAWIEASDSQA